MRMSGKLLVKADVNHFFKYNFDFYFHDLYGKLTFTPHRNHTLAFSSFANKDYEIGFEDSKIDGYLKSATDDDSAKFSQISKREVSYANNLFSFSWRAKISDKVNTNYQIYQSIGKTIFDIRRRAQFPSDLDNKFFPSRKRVEDDISYFNRANGADVLNTFNDTSLKFDVDYLFSERFQMNTGFAVSFYAANYRWEHAINLSEYVNLYFDYAPKEQFSFRKHFRSGSAYYEIMWYMSEKLHIRSGIRFSRWNLISDIIPEPRFQLVWQARSHDIFKIAAGKYSQGIATALERGLVQFLPLFFPTDERNKLETAEHYMLTWDHSFSRKTAFSCIAYLKNFHNVLKAVDSDPHFIRIPARSFGFNFDFNYETDDFSAKLSYMHGYSHRKMNGKLYDAFYDKRNIVKLFASRDLWHKYSLSLYWEFNTGQPYYTDEYFVFAKSIDSDFINRQIRPEYYTTQVDPGKIRYPYYHRLDIHLQGHFKLLGKACQPYLSVRNVYNRKNVLYYKDVYIERELDENNYVKSQNIVREAFSLAVLPTIGIKIDL